MKNLAKLSWSCFPRSTPKSTLLLIGISITVTVLIFKLNLPRNNEHVLNGFGALATAADLRESSENIVILKDWTSDLISSTTRLSKDSHALTALSSKVDECTRTLAMVSSQLTTQKIMIVDALKVCLHDHEHT